MTKLSDRMSQSSYAITRVWADDVRALEDELDRERALRMAAERERDARPSMLIGETVTLRPGDTLVTGGIPVIDDDESDDGDPLAELRQLVQERKAAEVHRDDIRTALACQPGHELEAIAALTQKIESYGWMELALGTLEVERDAAIARAEAAEAVVAKVHTEAHAAVRSQYGVLSGFGAHLFAILDEGKV